MLENSMPQAQVNIQNNVGADDTDAIMQRLKERHQC